ncbi:phospholipase D family protein [Shewanella sp. 6_MG-2023]|uniref:phospholipase D family protein n=1 Tax=Shewanella sp. 6_MG-2023 TaxID=3062660 RepID=UPI0026E42921|nr:phospholipase D family protein [Shewanella sp. 6_MG-2023]MDO6619522.1 phospholipase D family protein [Shewanella sp. 6_MG-2023]
MPKKNSVIFFCCVLCLTLIGCANRAEFKPLSQQYKLAPVTDSPLAQYIQSQLPQSSPQYSSLQYSQTSSQSNDDTQAELSLTGVNPLSDGIDAFIARLAMIEAATESIDLQYYIYRNDETGKILSLFLYKAAQRGVRVRVLLDDLTTANGDDGLMAIATHPNISVRLFNPSYERQYRGLAFLWNFSRLNHRMHNKSLTIDNLVTVVGGRNIGAEYFSADENVDFGDFDLLAIGDAVDKVSTQFDTYWNSAQVNSIEQLVKAAEPYQGNNTNPEQDNVLAKLDARASILEKSLMTDEYVTRLEKNTLLDRLQNQWLQWYWGEAQVVYDPPNKLERNPNDSILLDDLSYFFEQAQHQLLIVSPYFVPGDAATHALINEVKRGKEVTIVTNSLAATDVLAVHAGYQQYRQKLIEGGVKIYEVKGNAKGQKSKKTSWKGSSRTSLHAKTFIIDEQTLFVGSFNFDPRSALINTEMGLIIDNEMLAKKILAGLALSANDKAYEVVLKNGELVWLDHQHHKIIYAEPGAGFWRKFLADFLALLPIESQL